jgi:hypothetical protein
VAAFFAGLLALVSIPTYNALQTRARALRDQLFQIPSDGKASTEWYEGRSNLEELLGLHAGTGERFAAVLTILAPLVVGILSAFIPTIHGG